MSSLFAKLKLDPPPEGGLERGEARATEARLPLSTSHIPAWDLGTGNQASLSAFHPNGPGRGPCVGMGLCPAVALTSQDNLLSLSTPPALYFPHKGGHRWAYLLSWDF